MQLRLYKESSRGRGRGSRRKKQMVSIRIYGNLVVVKVFRNYRTTIYSTHVIYVLYLTITYNINIHTLNIQTYTPIYQLQ